MSRISDELRAQNRIRQIGRYRRSAAREIAQKRAALALADLLTGQPPEGFGQDETYAYRAELSRLKDRIGGIAPSVGLARGRA